MSGDLCPGCGAAAPVGARFCPACGHGLNATGPPLQPVRRAPPPRRRSPPRDHALWRQFAPALQLWLCLLALNGVLGLAGRAVDLSSPWIDVAATTLSALAVLACVRRDWPELAPLLRRSGFTETSIAGALVAMCVLVVLLQLWFWALGQLGADEVRYLADYREHDWPLWPAFALMAVCPPLFEELAFRGFIQRRLDGLMGPWEGVAVQGAMFAVLHMSPLVFPSHFLMGVVLGAVRRSTGSLYPGMVFHCLWNAWVLVRELDAS